MTVVAAFKFDDQVTTGETSRQPDGAHGGLGARSYQPHLFQRRYECAHFLGYAHFFGSCCAVAQTCFQLFAESGQHRRVAMAEDQRSVSADIIHVAVIVAVYHVSAIATLDKQRITTHAFKSAYRRIYPSRDHFLRLFEKCLGPIVFHNDTFR